MIIYYPNNINLEYLLGASDPMLLILATWGTETRSTIQGHLAKYSHDSILTNSWVWWHLSSQDTREAEIKRTGVPGQPR
jgi:hypothetical protein